MTEYERVKEETLLTDEEIGQVKLKRFPIQVTYELAFMFMARAVAQAQLDKFLKTDGIEIRADDQSLPKNPIETTDEISRLKHYWFNEGAATMLKPDKEGRHFIKVAPKEE